MTRLRAIAPLLIAAVLAAIALVTVNTAACDDPGHYEPVAGGYELVGGCLAPGDLVVPHPAPAQDVQVSDPTLPAKS